MSADAGRHFLQIPGPTNVPGRILRAIEQPTIDHRGPHFARLGQEVLEGIREVFKTLGSVVIFPSSGTGAWEAALVNTLSPGIACSCTRPATSPPCGATWRVSWGSKWSSWKGDWRTGADAARIEARLAEDTGHTIKAVAVVHNETSTGVTSRIGEVRKAIDNSAHPALLLVDTISSLASIDYRHDEWGVDVTVGGSQKGLMLPPGLGFNAVSDKARRASEHAGLPRAYWDWDAMLGVNDSGYFPYTPATNLLYGLREAIIMLLEEGLDHVFARHDRHAEATRRATRAWGFEVLAANPAEYSSSLTAVKLPEGYDADVLRSIILERFNMSLGNGLGILAGKVFRIGHLGDFNDLMLSGTLAGVEMGLKVADIPCAGSGVAAALEFLVEEARGETQPSPKQSALA